VYKFVAGGNNDGVRHVPASAAAAAARVIDAANRPISALRATHPPCPSPEQLSVKCAMLHEECRLGAHLPSLGREPVGG